MGSDEATFVLPTTSAWGATVVMLTTSAWGSIVDTPHHRRTPLLSGREWWMPSITVHLHIWRRQPVTQPAGKSMFDVTAVWLTVVTDWWNTSMQSVTFYHTETAPITYESRSFRIYMVDYGNCCWRQPTGAYNCSTSKDATVRKTDRQVQNYTFHIQGNTLLP